MNYVIDEIFMQYVGEQVLFDRLEDAVEQAKAVTQDSSNLFVVSGFEDGYITHIFHEGVCYKREVKRDFKVVK